MASSQCSAARKAAASGAAAAGPADSPLALFQRQHRTGRSLHVEVPKQVLTKTKLCKFFGVGVCTRGAACTYAHGEAELRSGPNLFRTEMCFEFVHSGACSKRATCRFAHGKAELRVPVAPAPAKEAWPRPPAAPQQSDAAAARERPAAAAPAEQLRRELEAMHQEAMRLRAELEQLRSTAALQQQPLCDASTAPIFSRQTTAATDASVESLSPRSGEASPRSPVPRASVDAGRVCSSSTFWTDAEVSEVEFVEEVPEEEPLETQAIACRTFLTLVPVEPRTARRAASCPPRAR